MSKTLNKFLKESGYVKTNLDFLKTKHYSLEAKINGIKGKFILDSGASNSCICTTLESNFNIISKETTEKASSATSEIINTKISKKNTIQIGNWKNTINLITFDMSHINNALSKKQIDPIDGIIGAAYGSAGERCMAVSVAVAVGDIANELVSQISQRAETLKVAPWTDSNSEMGPVISIEHKEKIENYISIGEKEGAKLVLDGRNIKIQGYEDGFFVGPTLIDNVTKDMTVYKEEIFGPVLCVIRVSKYEDALELVNNHAFGNGTSIYTSDGEISRHFTTHCNIGMVGVNVPIPVPMAFHSFGGWKQSLFGDHAMHGMEGVKFYTKLKTVTSRWPKSIKSGPEFKMPTN